MHNIIQISIKNFLNPIFNNNFSNYVESIFESKILKKDKFTNLFQSYFLHKFFKFEIIGKWHMAIFETLTVSMFDTAVT